jgi:hypothetical protein
MAMPDGLKDHRVVPRGKQRLPNALIEDLAAEWLEHGPACLRTMRSRDVTKFVQLAYSTLPRDVLVTVENRSLPGGLEPDDWALMRRVLDLIKATVPADSNAGPAEVFEVIESALRAHYAKPIEGAA